MESSLVSGVGAIATSSNTASGPGWGLDASGDEGLAAIGQHHHIARLDVRSSMLHRAEVVAGGVVEAEV